MQFSGRHSDRSGGSTAWKPGLRLSKACHEQGLSLSLINTLPRMLMGDEETAVPFLERGCFGTGFLLERGIGAGSDSFLSFEPGREKMLGLTVLE